VSLDVENNSAFRFPSISTTGNAISFSWVYGPPGKQFSQNVFAWDTRWRLQTDLKPHSANTMVLTNLEVPKIPGDYVIWFTMVQELVVWFHDAGMQPAVGEKKIRVARDGSVILLPASAP
jgi:hypothetical protein